MNINCENEDVLKKEYLIRLYNKSCRCERAATKKKKVFDKIR